MKSSTLVGILVTFAGYTVASYGYVLIRGWNIPFRQWVSPLNPYVWAGDPGPIPAGQIFPSQANATPSAPPSGGGTLGAALGGDIGAIGRAAPNIAQLGSGGNPSQQAAESSPGYGGQLGATIGQIIKQLTGQGNG